MRLSLRDPYPWTVFAFPKRVVLSVLTAHLCVGLPAAADVPSAAQREADEYFEQGKQALKRGDWTVACNRFSRSLELDPTPSTHVKVARCHERDGALRLAWDEYEQALEKIRLRATPDGHARDLQELVTSAQASLAKKLGILRVAFSQVVTEVGIVVDGRSVTPQAAQSGIVLEPGQHRVEASVANYRIEPVVVQIAAGEQRTVLVDLPVSKDVAAPKRAAPIGAQAAPIGAQAAPIGAQAPQGAVASNAVAPAGAQAPRGQEPSSRGAQRWVGIAASGLGLTCFGVAGYLGIRSQAKVRDARENDHCSGDYWCDSVGMARLREAEQLQTEALVIAAAGTLLGATGIVLWATAPARGPSGARSAPSIGLQVSPWGTSVGGLF
jgi:hypothetical protein